MTEKTAKELLAAIRELTNVLKAGQHIHHHHYAPTQPLYQYPITNPNLPWGTTSGTVSSHHGPMGSGGYTNTINQ